MDQSLDAARRIGENLELLRKNRRMTQALLSRRARVPRSTIAHLESGSGNPSIGSLLKIAAALRVSIEEFLANPHLPCEIIRAKDIPWHGRGNASARLCQFLPDALSGLQVERMEIAPGGFMRGAPHLRGTKEYLTCLSGKVRLTMAGQSYELDPWDVLAFPGDQAHSYHNPGRTLSVSITIVALEVLQRPR